MMKKILLFSIPFVLLAAFLSLGFLPFLLNINHFWEKK